MALLGLPNRLPNESQLPPAFDSNGNPLGGDLNGFTAAGGDPTLAQGQQTFQPGTGPANLGALGNQDYAIRAQLREWAKLPGANPSITNDPDYWVKRITETGGLNAGNTDYWRGLVMRPEWAPEGGGGGNATLGALGGDPASIMAQDPGYQFRLGEGLRALQASAAAKGTLLTGGTAKALARYGQDYASGEFGNIFGRNLSLAQLGENAAAGVGNFGSNYAANAGNLLTGGGNAAAAGTVGAANAWGGTLGNISNSALLYYLLNQNKGGATA